MAPKVQATRKSMCLGLSAATGGLLAVLSDIAQKQDASAVEHLNSALTGVIGVRTYPIVVALVLIALGVALSFIFSAESNKKAFYIGASILAIMMTAVPYSAPPSLRTTPSAQGTAAPAAIGWWDQVMIPAQVHAQSSAPNRGTYPVDVHLQTSDAKAVTSAIYTVIDVNSGEVIGRSTVQSGNFTFYAPNRPSTLRVQVDGYAIVERPLNPASRSMTIALTPSGVPLTVQRLFRK
jgi:hypothetical protein